MERPSLAGRTGSTRQTLWAWVGRQLRRQRLRAFVVVSQVSALFQIVAVVHAVGPSRVSDAISVLYLAAAAPATLLAQGAVYNYALSRPGFRRWTMAAGVTAASGPFAVAAAAAFMSSGRLYDHVDLYVLALGLGSGSVGFGVASVLAVRAALHGRPTFQALVSVPINVGIGVGVSIPFGTVETRVALGYAGFAWAHCAAAAWSGRGLTVSEDAGLNDRRDIVQLGYLVFGGMVGFGGPVILQMLSARLPAGQATILTFGSRLSVAVVNLGINTLLLEKVNWRLGGRSHYLHYIFKRCLVSGALGAPIFIGAAALAQPEVSGAMATVFGWIAASVLAAVAGRWMMLKSVRWAVGAGVLGGLVAYGVAIIAMAQGPSASIYFVGLTLPQVISVAISLLAVGHKGLLSTSLGLMAWVATLGTIVVFLPRIASVALVVVGALAATWRVRRRHA